MYTFLIRECVNIFVDKSENRGWEEGQLHNINTYLLFLKVKKMQNFLTHCIFEGFRFILEFFSKSYTIEHSVSNDIHNKQ